MNEQYNEEQEYTVIVTVTYTRTHHVTGDSRHDAMSKVRHELETQVMQYYIGDTEPTIEYIVYQGQ